MKYAAAAAAAASGTFDDLYILYMLIQLNTSNLCKNHSCRALHIQVWLFVPAALCTGEKVILSLHDQPEWGRIYTHLNEEFNLEAVTDEVVGVVRKGSGGAPQHQHHDQLRGHGSERVQDVLKYMI